MDLRKLIRGLQLLLFIGAATAWVVQGLYIVKFAPGHWLRLSSDPAVWGQFGDYVGGLLNPVFSFLGFAGLAITIALQARQNAVSDRHAATGQLQELLATSGHTIDLILQAPPALNKTKEFLRDGRSHGRFQNHLLGAAMATREARSRNEKPQPYLPALLEDLGLELGNLANEFHALCVAMAAFKKSGGSADVLNYYKIKYSQTVVYLVELGYITQEHGAYTQFDVAALLASATSVAPSVSSHAEPPGP